MLDIRQPHLVPCHDPLALLVYSAQASDVTTVMVDGNILMEERQLQTLELFIHSRTGRPSEHRSDRTFPVLMPTRRSGIYQIYFRHSIRLVLNRKASYPTIFLNFPVDS